MADKIMSWDEYFSRIAILSSKRSKDPKTKVGACIVDPETHKIVSIGYNGFPRGVEDKEERWNSDEKHNFVVHAEANAILNTSEDLHGKVLYITMFPCNECAKLIIQKGIKEVFYLDDKFLLKESGKIAMRMFCEAGVDFTKLNYKED